MRHGEIDASTAAGLRTLRKRIRNAEIPSSKLDESFNLATWNIREFGKKDRRKASLHFIAEILNQFDLVVITEVRDDVRELADVLRILGPYWKVVYADFIGDYGGNRERVAYVYDKRAVVFTGLASEAHAPRKKNKATGEWESTFDWWRSPYLASFRAGSFDFILLAVHIRWGKKIAHRARALEQLASWVDKRCKEKHVVDNDMIVVGDFNIPSTKQTDKCFAAATSKGLRVPGALVGLHGTNLAATKRYDQILHYPSNTNTFTGRGGVLDFYQGDHASLFPGVRMTKRQFTYELSDHLPLWIQVSCDTEDEELDQILNPRRRRGTR